MLSEGMTMTIVIGHDYRGQKGGSHLGHHNIVSTACEEGGGREKRLNIGGATAVVQPLFLLCCSSSSPHSTHTPAPTCQWQNSLVDSC